MLRLPVYSVSRAASEPEGKSMLPPEGRDSARAEALAAILGLVVLVSVTLALISGLALLGLWAFGLR
jgi:hypothetical protein